MSDKLIRRDVEIPGGTVLEVTVQTVYSIRLDDDWTIGADEPMTLEWIERVLGRWDVDRVRTLRNEYDADYDEIADWRPSLRAGEHDPRFNLRFERPWEKDFRERRDWPFREPEYVDLADITPAEGEKV